VIIESAVGEALLAHGEKLPARKSVAGLGKEALLAGNKKIDTLPIYVKGFENSKRKTQLIKVSAAYKTYRQMLLFYGLRALIELMEEKECSSLPQLRQSIPSLPGNTTWHNIGGQLMSEKSVQELLRKIRTRSIRSWEGVHSFYQQKGESYYAEKQAHALSVLQKMTGVTLINLSTDSLNDWLDSAIKIQRSITGSIRSSRMKDYENPYRQMLYSNEAEMLAVLGDPNDNSFLREQERISRQFAATIRRISRRMKLG
jgi:hypothetical protein